MVLISTKAQLTWELHRGPGSWAHSRLDPCGLCRMGSGRVWSGRGDFLLLLLHPVGLLNMLLLLCRAVAAPSLVSSSRRLVQEGCILSWRYTWGAPWPRGWGELHLHPAARSCAHPLSKLEMGPACLCLI